MQQQIHESMWDSNAGTKLKLSQVTKDTYVLHKSLSPFNYLPWYFILTGLSSFMHILRLHTTCTTV